MRSSLPVVCLLACGVFAQKDTKDTKPDTKPDRPICPKNSVHQDCGSPCPAVCGKKEDPASPCMAMCVSGCQCKAGYQRVSDERKSEGVEIAGRNDPDNFCVPEEKCAAPEFDCTTKEVWTDEKTKWCCKNKGEGCVKAKCPKNSHYQDCGKACPAVCGMPAQAVCIEMCVSGCQCDAGYQRFSDEDSTKGVEGRSDTFCVKIGDDCPMVVVDPEPYNCMTKEMWSEDKAKWCCANKQLGCKNDEPTDYNCMTKEMWTDDKKKWCCAKKGMGCVKKEVVPCDEKLRAYMSKPIAAGAKVPQCDGKLWQRRQCWGSTGTCECVDPKTGEYVGPENADRTCPDMKEEPTKFDCKTREMWTDEKKEWCCKKEKVGCKKDEPADEFDCRTEEVWTEAKQKWCCAKKRLGCKKENEEDDKKFNCMTREMWTDEKKEWCCKNKKAGCDKKDDDKKDKKDKKLKKGDVCKSGGVETGRFMDRSKECPKRTVCKPVKGQVAIGGEVDHTCQRVAKWNRRMSVITKRGTTMKQAIAEAAKFKEALLRLLKLDSDDVLEVLMKFVCRIPAARAALGITDADRKSSRCTALDAATRRNLRALQQQKLDDDILAIDTELRTDAGSKDITSIAREAAKDIEDFDIDQVIETGATIGEGYVPDVNDADKDSGESKSKFSIAAIAALVGLCMASTFAVFVVQFISKRKAAAAQSPVDTDAEKTVGTPASALESSFREMETTDVASI